MAKYFYQYVQIFSIFIEKILSLFQNNALIGKKKKTLMQHSMRKEKLRKVGLCFITSCFIKPFKMINLFWLLFLKLIRSAVFAFWYQEYRKGKLNIYFKNNFNLLVMNVIQLNFLYWQKVQIWHLLKGNHKRSLLFVVVPTLINWIKTKIFTDYDDAI